MSSFFVKLFGEKRFVYSVKVFPASIKSINPIQKYPHIIESYACILKIFVMFLILTNALISFGMFYTKRIEIFYYFHNQLLQFLLLLYLFLFLFLLYIFPYPLKDYLIKLRQMYLITY